MSLTIRTLRADGHRDELRYNIWRTLPSDAAVRLARRIMRNNGPAIVKPLTDTAWLVTIDGTSITVRLDPLPRHAGGGG